MRRRDFISLIGGATATWPMAARGQQPSGMPVVGFLSRESADTLLSRARAFRFGLGETGYVDGRNVTIEYRWAEGQRDRIGALAADLVRREVSVIVAAGDLEAQATKAATTTIPIVFYVALDPIASGLVASLNRPGANVTGITNLSAELGPKRMELLRQLVPTATTIAALVDPTGVSTPTFSQDLLSAARTLGFELQVLHATTERDFDTVFSALHQSHAGGLVIGPGPFLNSRSGQLAALAFRHAVPAIFQLREAADAGGLMSYGGSITDAYRVVGGYAGRILKGEKPADLPVQQTTKVELIINLKTAKALGLTVPLSLLGRADEVIE
jgi:putative ABC transport system substrate-binding protein